MALVGKWNEANILLLFRIFYVASFFLLCCTFLDRWGLTNTVLYTDAQIYTYYPTFWLHCPWRNIPFLPALYISSFSFFFLLLSLISVLLLLAASLLVHVVPWPTSCQPPQLSTASGNFSFRIKLHGISHLPSPFPCFVTLFSSDFSLKLSLFKEHKKYIT